MRRRAGRILVVDDDRQFQETMCLVLTQAGYEATCASNGREALHHLETGETPALILLDVQMPVMGGEDFRSEQLKIRRLRTVPVIVVSADSEIESKAERMSVPYLVKPVSGAALLAAVARHAARS
jgi:two-component system chemotaxis response regulator CheY